MRQRRCAQAQRSGSSADHVNHNQAEALQAQKSEEHLWPFGYSFGLVLEIFLGAVC